MPLILGKSGVNKELNSIYLGKSGVNKNLGELYLGKNGVNKSIFTSAPISVDIKKTADTATNTQGYILSDVLRIGVGTIENQQGSVRHWYRWDIDVLTALSGEYFYIKTLTTSEPQGRTIKFYCKIGNSNLVIDLGVFSAKSIIVPRISQINYNCYNVTATSTGGGEIN